jgi:signal transduction histidine kinase
LIIVFGSSIVVVLAAAWIYAGRALKPIAKVIQQADEITISSLNLRLDEGNGKDEIAQLSKTFNFVLDRLESSFEIQKNFIANASHELRTPLTAITGQLEVTMLNERSTEEYKRTIQSVLDDIKNLNSLSNRLLLLAQTSQETLDAGTEPIRIDEILWQSKEDLLKRNSTNEIQIEFDKSLDDESKFMIKADEHLAKVAIYNLVENGCKYSQNHKVNVAVKAYKTHITLTFQNDGDILKEDLQKIFQPFHRGQNTQIISGHGIGLSLVERIVILLRGQMKVMSSNGKVTFTIRFPLFEG